MSLTRFVPEGWNGETAILNKDSIYKYMETKEVLQGKVEQCDKDYNLHINLGNGLKGIIPRDEVEAINVEENGCPKSNICTGKVNKFVQFKVKEIKNQDTIILSRKDVQDAALNWIKHDLAVGQKVVGIVKNIKPYGAFIEIGGGVVGLVHIEDLSVARIKTPFERLNIGQKVDIVVKSIDKEQGKVILSYKETLGTWEENTKGLYPGMNMQGIIRETEKNKNGIFIELKPNLVGMAEYTEGLKYGQKVNVCIKKIDPNKKKIKLLISEVGNQKIETENLLE